MGLFLAAHGAGIALVRIIESCLLGNCPSVFNNSDLATNFVVQGLFNKTEGVDIFEFGASAQCGLAVRSNGDIGITAKRSLLQIAVTDIKIAHQRMKCPQVSDGLRRGAHIRFCDHFKQRCASAVEINTAQLSEGVVNRLAGIFFKMSAHQSDVVVGISDFKADRSPTDNG